MVGMAIKNLAHERGRLVLSLMGIAFAVVLILILEGFAAGVYEQAAAYPRHSGAELFVVQDGVDGMQSARSIIPEDLKGTLDKIKGVKHVAGVFAAPIMFERNGRKTPVLLIGYRPLDKMGGPWKLDSGRRPRRRGEAVLDLALAERDRIRLGDRVRIMGQTFKVVGLSRETTSWMNPYIFTLRSDATRLLSAQSSVSYFLIHLRPSTGLPSALSQTRGLAKGYDVLTAKRMAANDTAILEDVLSSPLTVMVAISYIIGTLVIGLTVYTAVFAKLGEFGVIKAIGGANRRLYALVFEQALVLATLGFILGVLLAFLTADRIEASFPQFLIEINSLVIARTFLTVLVMGAFAALVPMRLITGVEPANVFRS